MTQNTINFNSVKEIGLSFEAGPFGFAGASGVDPEFGGAINAVDIDWNSAELATAIQSLESDVQEGAAVSDINTTGDLIKVVAQLQAQVNVLTTLVKGLYNALQA